MANPEQSDLPSISLWIPQAWWNWFCSYPGWETFVASSDTDTLSHSLGCRVAPAPAGLSTMECECQQGPSEHASCRPKVYRNEQTHTYLSPLSWKWMGKTSTGSQWGMGREARPGFRNSLWNKGDVSSCIKEEEKNEHLKTVIEGFWAGDETNKMQLESIH